MTIPGNGKLLTAEQSVRLAMLDCLERDQQIAMIVAGLRQSALTYRSNPGGWCPRQFYSQTSGNK